MRATSGRSRDQFGALLDVPVFDKGKTAARDPNLSVGLAARSSGRTEETKGFSRNPNDARPGTPVPCGEPHPDRLAIAEALRAQLEAREAKWKLPGGMVATDAKGNYRRGGERQRKSNGQTPDIPEPLGPYHAPETTVIIGRRGARALRFATIREAVVCITGEPATRSGLNAITNAARGTVRGAYGWTWERVGWAHGKKRGA